MFKPHDLKPLRIEVLAKKTGGHVIYGPKFWYSEEKGLTGIFEYANIHQGFRVDNEGRENESRNNGMPQLSQFKAEFFKALAHPLRIRILDALRGGGRTVNDLCQALSVEQSTLSQQLAVLRNRNLVVGQKNGNNVFYSIQDPAVFRLLDVARSGLINTAQAARSRGNSSPKGLAALAVASLGFMRPLLERSSTTT